MLSTIMQQLPKKRPTHAAITLHESFEHRIHVVAFLLGYANTTAFIYSLLENAEQQNIAEVEPETTTSGRSVFFAKHKGLKIGELVKSSKELTKSEQKEIVAFRFYVNKNLKNAIDMLTKKSPYSYYSDFIIAMIVEVEKRHSQQIDSYLATLRKHTESVKRNERKKNPVPILPKIIKQNERKPIANRVQTAQ